MQGHCPSGPPRSTPSACRTFVVPAHGIILVEREVLAGRKFDWYDEEESDQCRPRDAVEMTRVGVVHRPWLNLLTSWFLTGHPPSGTALIVGVGASLVELTFALLLMAVTWAVLAPRLYGEHPGKRDSAWVVFLTQPTPAVHVPARVFLTDGTSWVGQVCGFTADNEWANREIALLNPLRADAKGSRGPVLPGTIIIPAEMIAGVHTTQVPKQAPANAGPSVTAYLVPGQSSVTGD
jgi:hypothetical protein